MRSIVANALYLLCGMAVSEAAFHSDWPTTRAIGFWTLSAAFLAVSALLTSRVGSEKSAERVAGMISSRNLFVNNLSQLGILPKHCTRMIIDAQVGETVKVYAETGWRREVVES